MDSGRIVRVQVDENTRYSPAYNRVSGTKRKEHMADTNSQSTTPGIGQQLINSLESLVELQIYTCVGEGEFVVRKDQGGGVVIEPKAAGMPVSNTFYTEINLISGDIINILPKDDLDAADPLLKIHAENVNKGTEIVAANVKALKEILQDASEDLQKWLGLTATP
jgi:hypothetical protein